MNEFETKKLVKIPEGWDFLEVDDDYNVIVVREKKEAQCFLFFFPEFLICGLKLCEN